MSGTLGYLGRQYLYGWHMCDGNHRLGTEPVGDPLLEVGFRTFDVDICFRKGYGKERLTESEERRALWYDVYMAVLQALECEYRHYDTMEMYERGVRLLGEQMKRMRLLQGQQDR